MCRLMTLRAQISIVMSIFGERAYELKSGNFTVYKCFSSHFPLQKPAAGIMKLEWGVEQTSERNHRWEMTWRWLERQNYSYGNMAVHECSIVGEF